RAAPGRRRPERLPLALLVLRPLGILRWLQRRRGYQGRRDRRRHLVYPLGFVVPVGFAALVGLDVRRASAIGIDDGDRVLDLVPRDPVGAAPDRRPAGQLKPGRRRLALVARDRAYRRQRAGDRDGLQGMEDGGRAERRPGGGAPQDL